MHLALSSVPKRNPATLQLRPMALPQLKMTPWFLHLLHSENPKNWTLAPVPPRDTGLTLVLSCWSAWFSSPPLPCPLSPLGKPGQGSASLAPANPFPAE